MKKCTIEAVSSLILCMVVLTGAAVAPDSGSEPSRRFFKEDLHRQVCTFANARYLLYHPEAKPVKTRKTWPVILYLHGSDWSGSDADYVRKTEFIRYVETRTSFPAIVVAPQCDADKPWEYDALVALIDEVIDKHHGDPDRIYVTGFSLGGMGTWSLALFAPDRIAAIAPMAGAAQTGDFAGISHIPAWIVHGAKDNLIPVEEADRAVRELRKAGGTVKYSRFDTLGHGVGFAACGDSLLGWFLQFDRKSNELYRQVRAGITFSEVKFVEGKGLVRDTLRATVVNKYVNPVDVQMALGGLGGQNTDNTTMPILPLGQAQFNFPLSATDNFTPENPPTIAAFFKDRKRRIEAHRTFEIPLSVLHPVVYVATPLTIDGNLSDWSSKTKIAEVSERRAVFMGQETWTGPKDLSASIHMAWDSSHLYLGVVIRDDVQLQPYIGGGIWQADCIQFGIDALDNSTGAGYGPDDYEMGLGLSGRETTVWAWYSGTRGEGPVKEAKCVAKRIEGATVYELVLPAESIAPLALRHAGRFGFDIMLNDNDDAAVQQQTRMVWQEGFLGTKDPSKYGKMMLTR